MSMLDALRDRWPDAVPVRPLARRFWSRQHPTFREAKPALIDAAAARAAARPSGNWFVFAASTDIRPDRPFGTHVGPVELVAWRDAGGGLVVGPGACPHLGAPLAEGKVECGTLRCRWHGMPLDREGGFGWNPLPAHDDGVLVWVRLDRLGGETPLPTPVLPERPDPTAAIAAVATATGTCEPGDIIANRLDPWHGSWFHPYAFARLTVEHAPNPEVVEEADDRFLVDVTYLLGARLGVPVRAEFHCPEPRTVVMRITAGEGTGSVVETHATPLPDGPDGRARTSVIEAVIATSDRPGFTTATRIAPLLRPLMRWGATRLWRDDLAYAERRYALRTTTEPAPHLTRNHT
ncbi:CrtV-methyltransferase-like protein [Actinokineospora spheciospongiae]|uniref:CrtV-methyltransferase-like protein n=1 Tax=Actinokineospora spheciospongiae TaxID=909613 RepID=W7IS51_9PSEU|nr:DUF5914 domain-containing protein [Actinokineospora spheciospongiae]EWC63173.1 CrtV-methyltransferase-like protein [Actinokineospora spheciospongiae]